jgi:hypothetical protein
VEALVDLHVEMAKIGVDIVAGIMSGIAEKAKELPGWIKSQITDPLPGWAKDFLGISSPSKVMMPIGEMISAGIAAGITSGASKYVQPAMNGMAQFVESQAYNAERAGWSAGNNPNQRPGFVHSQAYNAAKANGTYRYAPGSAGALARGYASGTPFVPSDGLAYLHKGEAVIPAAQNKTTNNSNRSMNFYGPVTFGGLGPVLGRP